MLAENKKHVNCTSSASEGGFLKIQVLCSGQALWRCACGVCFCGAVDERAEIFSPPSDVGTRAQWGQLTAWRTKVIYFLEKKKTRLSQQIVKGSHTHPHTHAHANTHAQTWTSNRFIFLYACILSHKTHTHKRTPPEVKQTPRWNTIEKTAA